MELQTLQTSNHAACAHHDLPWQFRKKFFAKGIDINDARYGRWAKIDEHQVWHQEKRFVRFPSKKGEEVNFNEAWNLFLNDKKYGAKNFSDMTPDDIEEFLYIMRSTFN